MKRSECQRRWRSRLGSLKYRLTHRLYNTRDVEEGLYQVAYRNGWDADTEAKFSPSLLLFASCKEAQKKQELRVASQQALFLKALFLLRCGDYAAVTGLAHKFRTQSCRQIISSYCSQLAIQLSRPTASLFRRCNRYCSWAC